MTQERKIIRCAVYTRKSTEHNLDLEFNSLHAQREACEAYVKSQLHEGWTLIPDHYDDGGISGASLDRPDIQRLLADIQAKKVDNVVVYKVDRLTRSLTDFARLVELFDAHNVSFVSVTQSFNTTTSMGRLTLNVLLSFAQFEREVIGERVRDKISASKRKGLWMGGTVPLGYANQDKKLVVIADDAEKVRWIFERYLSLGSMGRLIQEMEDRGVRTKTQQHAAAPRGGNRFGKGALSYLLRNRVYVGEIAHKGEVFAAGHDPIIDRPTFESVQALLAANSVARKVELKAPAALLAGLLFDSAGNRMSPSHSRKKGICYRYYVSQAVLQSRKSEAGEVARIAAQDIEVFIEKMGTDRGWSGRAEICDRQAVEANIEKITVRAQSIEIQFRAPQPRGSKADPDISVANCPTNFPWPDIPVSTLFQRAGRPKSGQAGSQPHQAVLTAVGKARLWLEELRAGGTIADIATRESKGERQARLLLPLAFLSPTAVRGLITSSSPVRTITDIARSVPLMWAETNPTQQWSPCISRHNRT